MSILSGWEIEAEPARVDDGSRFVTEVSTGRAWGRCGCGHRAEGAGGEPLPSAEVIERLWWHIATDHPDWPYGVRP